LFFLLKIAVKFFISEKIIFVSDMTFFNNNILSDIEIKCKKKNDKIRAFFLLFFSNFIVMTWKRKW